jgi:hypothetical protein
MHAGKGRGRMEDRVTRAEVQGIDQGGRVGGWWVVKRKVK